MSKNKNNKRGVKKRVFSPPMIGDPGPQTPEHYSEPLPIEAVSKFDSMSTRDLISLALKVGIDPREVCGVAKCAEHLKMKKLGEGFHNSKHFPSFVKGIDVLWCNACWSWFRTVKPLELGNDAEVEVLSAG